MNFFSKKTFVFDFAAKTTLKNISKKSETKRHRTRPFFYKKLVRFFTKLTNTEIPVDRYFRTPPITFLTFFKSDDSIVLYVYEIEK